MTVPFINRELSWLEFNRRVLLQAEKPESKPLDKLKFLAISASNLDEFFMVRVAYLHDNRHDEAHEDSAGLTPHMQLDKVIAEARQFQDDQQHVFKSIRKELKANGVRSVRIEDLPTEKLTDLDQIWQEEIRPVLTPLAVDKSRPFPFLVNDTINIGVRMKSAQSDNIYAIVQVPQLLARFIKVEIDDETYLFPIEELIQYKLPEIFDMYKVASSGVFRITRSADFDPEEDTDNLLEEMKKTIKKRKRGQIIRMELMQPFDEKLSKFLLKTIRVRPDYVFEINGLLDLADLMEIANAKGLDPLRTPAIIPKRAADFSELESPTDIFPMIKKRDRMLSLPYESFDTVIDFIEQAATDPDVLAIKQTLYRVSGHSQVIAALEQAAEAGKSVTVLVELKARFDEENNIAWAQKLEHAGCHVIYGIPGLKTHCKVTMVVRREHGHLQRYVHLSTGNYNDSTAKVYTDIGLFSARDDLGEDVASLFDNLTGYTNPPDYQLIKVAPTGLRPFFKEKIYREIEIAKSGRPSRIDMKLNAMLDEKLIRELYKASEAGVEIRLLVRGICALLPDAAKISEHIKVRSILGEQLEHSRMYIFYNDGNPEYYLGSADIMPRNLDRRVEVVFPVLCGQMQSRIVDMFELLWSDNVGCFELESNGKYRKIGPADGANVIDSQHLQYVSVPT
ncbi:MAG: polyphosphate kinase 1 [Clostridiales Family XIII bacterium]|jgi:polyphosphate kinase|nr:polyphosphate kinase 1 [Clostridiales Family XIII bacterium]